MKKILPFFFLLVPFFLTAQPLQIAYQAKAYNASNVLLVNQPVGIRVSILDASNSNQIMFLETHTATTNSQGVYSIIIGNGPNGYTGNLQSGWGSGDNKVLKTELDPVGGFNYSIISTTRLWSVPYALRSQMSKSLQSYKVVPDVSSLHEAINEGKQDGDIAFVKSYYPPASLTAWDEGPDGNNGDNGGGHFIWKTDPIFLTSGGPGYFSENNDGTIVAVWGNDTGRWVRMYEGPISIAYFGANRAWTSLDAPLQKAIDFAAKVSKGSPNYKTYFPGTTIFIPNGAYSLNTVVLRDGITIVGENTDMTVIHGSRGADHLFTIESGLVRISLSNFSVQKVPNETNGIPKKTAFYLAGQQGEYGVGGLLNSSFKNIAVSNWEGDAFSLRGGVADYTTAHHNLLFEHVRVSRNANKRALFIEGLNSVFTFTNCEFDGSFEGPANWPGTNVLIKGSIGGGQLLAPTSISFLNSTFQNADYGVQIDYAENVTFDTCWFETLGIGVDVKGVSRPSRAINVLNNRFANVSGYGAMHDELSNLLTTNGSCVKVLGHSFVNITGNHVEGTSMCSTCNFVTVDPNNNGGVRMSNNTFRPDADGKIDDTKGIMTIAHQAGSLLGGRQLYLATVNGNGNVNTIESTINTGERIMIKAGVAVVFTKLGNIRFPGGLSTLTLNTGQTAEFMKMDYQGQVVFQLVSIKR
ncbi:MAG TPA: hypothetical protein VF581_11675 [Flavobacterium sp.]|jgi:hypothetical protein